MTATEERLTDALTAAADAVDAGTLRPLVAPPQRPQRRLAWAVPLAAAASVLLVIGLAVAGQWFGAGRVTHPVAGRIPRYYVASTYPGGGSLVVRSAATGAITATVPIPGRVHSDLADGIAVVAAASHGTFFAAIYWGQAAAERVYRFRVTVDGKVSGLAKVPGSTVARGSFIDAMAASPDGSRVAVGVTRELKHGAADQITVVRTDTGARTEWRGTDRHAGDFSVASLSWTAGGGELVVLGQWCQQGSVFNEDCDTTRDSAHRTAEVWALNPDSGGGQLGRGHLLLRQSARNPIIVQAVISRDGSFITAAVLTGGVGGTGGISATVPASLSVRQISVATGRQLRVLYQRQLPRTESRISEFNQVGLAPDSSGRHWLVWGVLNIASDAVRPVSFSGWIRDGGLVPLPLARGSVNSAAW
jgi:hypothetical protein